MNLSYQPAVDPGDPIDPLHRAPFRWSPRRDGVFPLRVSGAPPAWLKGKLMRISPGVFDRGAFHAEHLFDGLGMLYAFELGEAQQYRQQLLESKALAASDRGERYIAGFDISMRRSLFERLKRPLPSITDNANVNVIPWQGEWLAMTETSKQHVISDTDARSRGLYDYDDRMGRSLSMSAHPHFDHVQNALVNVGYRFGPVSELVVYRQRWSSRAREVEGRLRLLRPFYLHSFGLTPKHAVLIDHPLTLYPLGLLFSERSFYKQLRWEPERGTRLWKLDRTSGDFVCYETEPLFCFHTVNSFDDGSDVVIDFVAYDSPQLAEELRRDHLRAGAPLATPRFMRARLPHGARRARLEQLSTARFDFPQIAYKTNSGRPYGHVWGTHLYRPNAGPGWSSKLVNLELASDQARHFEESDYMLGEAVMVSRPGTRSETDGVLLSVGAHRTEDRSVLLVIDASRLELLARYEVDVAIPLGFHGSFAFSG